MSRPYTNLNTVDELVRFIETSLPGWEWLLRNGGSDFEKKPPCFAHVMTPDFHTSHAGRGYKAYRATPVEALKVALDQIDPAFFVLETLQ